MKRGCEFWVIVVSPFYGRHLQHRNPSKTEQAPAENWEFGAGDLWGNLVLIIKNMSCAVLSGYLSIFIYLHFLINLFVYSWIQFFFFFWDIYHLRNYFLLWFHNSVFLLFKSLSCTTWKQPFTPTSRAQGGEEFLAMPMSCFWLW